MVTKQGVDDARRDLEELKTREADLSQEIAALRAEGLVPMSLAACSNRLKYTQKDRELDELTADFFAMKDDRGLSKMSATSKLLLHCMKQNFNDCIEADEAMEHFKNVLQERLMGDNPIDLQRVGDLDPSFRPFKDRALALIRDDKPAQQGPGFELADRVRSLTGVAKLQTIIEKENLAELQVVVDKERLEEGEAVIDKDTPRSAAAHFHSDIMEGSIFVPSPLSEQEYSEGEGCDAISMPSLQYEKRPRIRLGYHTKYKMDVYCFFAERLNWATEKDVTSPRFGTITGEGKAIARALLWRPGSGIRAL